MSQIENNRQIFSLLEVTRSIQKTIAERYQHSYWIKAEMNTLNYYRQSGHCYPELVEKREGKVIAQVRANLWKEDYDTINQHFLEVLKEPLKDGIKILLLGKIGFDPNYGLSLRILDIDPAYTLGDLEREKQETLLRLHQEGIFNSNKTQKLPLLPQRIAIISDETSKGYADFLKVLGSNHWGYHFFHLLFPSLLQGEKAVNSIRNQLKRIQKVRDHFDVVAIIRGGGGDIGLSCYNNYELSREIALFPIPVITGIGHATNETVAEIISYSNAITPTKLAEFLIQKFHNYSVPVQNAKDKIADRAIRLLREAGSHFLSEAKLFRSATGNILISNRSELKHRKASLLQQATLLISDEKETLGNAVSLIKKDIPAYLAGSSKQIREFAWDIRKIVNFKFNYNKLEIQQNKRSVRIAFKGLATHHQKSLVLLKDEIHERSKQNLKTQQAALVSLEKQVHNMNPINVLKRGYSITLQNGKAIKNYTAVKEGDQLDTLIFEGKIRSIVQSSQKTDEP